MDYDLGYVDDETCRLEPLPNPFGPTVLDPAKTDAFVRVQSRSRSAPHIAP
jgi:hypothetical protein